MGRKQKVAESTSSLGTEQVEGSPEFESGTSSAPSEDLQLVEDPGPVKRIVFEGTAPPPPPPRPAAQAAPQENEYSMAEASAGPGRPALESSTSIHTIREEVDRIRAPDPDFAGAPRRANLRSWRSETLYRTEQGGEVRAYEGPTGRTLTLADGGRERRFSEADVDRVIANVDLQRQPAQPEPVQETAPEPETEEPRRRRGLFGFRRRERPEPEPAAEEPVAEKEYQPQCSALTEEGAQCRNSARGGSKYCSSHYGYQPRTVQGIHQSRDTEPRFDSSRDTLPGGGWDPSHQGGAQCSAITAEGAQCRNPVVAGSPHCGSHQGYSEPSAAQIVGSVDTKPRWSKAKDTKPSTRKAAKGSKSRR